MIELISFKYKDIAEFDEIQLEVKNPETKILVDGNNNFSLKIIINHSKIPAFKKEITMFFKNSLPELGWKKLADLRFEKQAFDLENMSIKIKLIAIYLKKLKGILEKIKIFKIIFVCWWRLWRYTSYRQNLTVTKNLCL